MNFNANDYSTALPAEWEDRTMITLVAPFEPGKFAANIVITKHFIEANGDLEKFVEEQTKLLRESLPTFELLDFRTTVINDLPACQQLHRFQSQNGFLQQVQTFLLSDSVIYAITGTAAVEDFHLHTSAFKTVVENFRVKEPNTFS